jgi:hypothetical protein
MLNETGNIFFASVSSGRGLRKKNSIERLLLQSVWQWHNNKAKCAVVLQDAARSIC